MRRRKESKRKSFTAQSGVRTIIGMRNGLRNGENNSQITRRKSGQINGTLTELITMQGVRTGVMNTVKTDRQNITGVSIGITKVQW